MEVKNINATARLIAPLYDYDFENNDSVELIKFFHYCPELPYPDKLIVLYKVKNKKGADEILFPLLFKKEYVIDDKYLVVLLDIPKEYFYDYELLIEGDVENMSWEYKDKVLLAKINRDVMLNLHDVLTNSPNLTFREKKPFEFGIDDMLELSDLENKSRSDNTMAFY